MTRAFYRSYHRRTGKQAHQVTRCHVLNEGGKHPGREAYCYTSATDHQESAAVILDPMPAQAPAGLAWCPTCIGRLAESFGALDFVAGELAGIALTSTDSEGVN